MTLAELKGTWKGSCELWKDPLGDVVETCEAQLEIGADVKYTWSYEGKAQQGTVTLTETGADFTDTWHQPDILHCTSLSSKALLCVEGTYMDVWGWRIALCYREPTGEVVVQMTNIAPWGEEARAVRMTAKRA